MCGITGIFFYGDRSFMPDKALLERMTDSLKHRGPDGGGVFLDQGIGLGHRRLAIIDPTPAGDQPMVSHSGNTIITYNGELYNFRELRNQLRALGYVFNSQTDTEVVLNAYEEWGISAVERFNGIFAFALWDVPRKTLFLARDRFGVKPLFTHDDGTAIRFGSEIKSILADTQVSRSACPSGLNALLTFGYTYAPLTGFRDIHQLSPGSVLKCDDGGITRYTYWSLNQKEMSPKPSFDEALELFDHTLLQAVERQMVSDVPLGAFLSGGLDSTAIVYAMTLRSEEPVRTFNIGFEHDRYDESRYAREAAEQLGTEYHSRRMDLDMVDTLTRAAYHCDDPFADSSLLCLYQLSKVAREHVKVALSGDGADELLGGYSTYLAGYLSSLARKVPGPVRSNLLRPISRLFPITDNPYSPRELLRRFLTGLDEPPGRDHATWRVYCSKPLKEHLLSPEFLEQIEDDDPIGAYAERYLSSAEESCRLKKMLRADLLFYLPSDMLVKVDRMSMAHGLEVRVPMLDNELVDLCASLPSSYLVHLWHGRKRILRESLRKNLRDLSLDLDRPKHGFNAPIGYGLRNELLTFFKDTIRSKPFCEDGPFIIERLEALADQHKEKKLDASHELFAALSLALWWNSFSVVP